jgi:dTDP-4-amino-4,6-dideoxygalactose transaminase
MIPMVDLKKQYEDLKNEIEPVVLETLNNAHYVLGENVKAFENEIAKYLDVKYAIGVASGTDALELALLGAGIKPGDEIITPSFTFIATVEAILQIGAVPIFADISENDFNIDISKITALITEKTKAILPVHLYGHPVNMTQLMSIADEHELKVIEDCAQSCGGQWNKQMTGSFGIAGCFSFYPSKNLSCFGDGGLVTTNDDEVYNNIVALRNHGSYTRYHHEKLGINSRLDEIQAAILRVKLHHLDRFNQQRHSAAQQYNALLSDIVAIPKESSMSEHIFHQYTILHEQRDSIQKALNKQKIGSAIYYPIPIHKQPLFDGKYDHISLPITDKLTTQCLSLPMFPELTQEQIEEISHVIRQSLDV